MRINISKYFSKMNSTKGEFYSIIKDKPKPSIGEGVSGFWKRAKFSFRLMFLEKEIITFAVLQWVCVVLGYFLWTQIWQWLPEDTYRDNRPFGITDIIFLVWSGGCVGLVTFPLGALTGCMGAVHFLNKQGKESTIPACLKMVFPRLKALWIFSWIDGWITVDRILERLPKKRRLGEPAPTLAQKALEETLYYAWKVCTIGIIPGLVTGRGIIDASKRSLNMVMKKFKDVVILRVGYSALCWIVGITAYIGAIFMLAMFPNLVNFSGPTHTGIYNFYFWGGVPITIAVGVVMLFLRPIYIISSCDIYADYVQESGENLMLPPPPHEKNSWTLSEIVAIIALVVTIIGIAVFGPELGMVDTFQDWLLN
jgi:hypothetical protein